MLEVLRVGHQATIQELHNRLDAPRSIYRMNKAGLVLLAYKELGMSRQQAEDLSVAELRELLRQSRVENQVVRDPMTYLPRGLSRMRLADLQAACRDRNITFDPDSTRAQLMLLIRSQVDGFLWVETPIPATPMDTAMEIEEEETSPLPKAKCKSKGKGKGPKGPQ